MKPPSTERVQLLLGAIGHALNRESADDPEVMAALLVMIIRMAHEYGFTREGLLAWIGKGFDGHLDVLMTAAEAKRPS